MIALAVVLFIMGVIAVAVGFVLFANGAGAAPHERTKDDPTGVKRATTRTPWKDVFRHVPKSVRLVTGQESTHEERLAAGGAVLLLIGIVAFCVAVLSVIVAYM